MSFLYTVPSPEEETEEGEFEYPDPDIASAAFWPGQKIAVEPTEAPNVDLPLQQIEPLVREAFPSSDEDDEQLDPLVHFAPLNAHGVPLDPDYDEERTDE